MLDFVFDLLVIFSNSAFLHSWFFVFLAFLFLCTVPFILRYFFRR